MAEGKQYQGARNRRKEASFAELSLEIGNKPPQAPEAEEAVLGALLLDSDNADTIVEELDAACFYDPRNRMIYEAAKELLNVDHMPADIVTVTGKLKAKGNLEAVGGPGALAALTENVGSAAHSEYYIKVLRQKKIQRDLIQASYKTLKDAFDDSIDVDQLVDTSQSRLYEAIQSAVRKDVANIRDILAEVHKDIMQRQATTGYSGVPSGYVSIDRVTQGWQKANLIILAARPSVGKTAFALNIARNAAVDHHRPVAVFSLEMSCLELAKRLVVTETGLSADKIKGAIRMEDYEWQQLEYKIKNLEDAPLYIDDTPSLPIMEFRTKAKNLVHNKGVELIVVDYLQLMQGPSELKGLREQEVAAISRMLKATAKELDIPIIALSQLSRDSVKRPNSTGKPQLSDLRESGSIEQDADIVIFIHRPDVVGLSPNPGDREKTQILIAKHRNGEVKDIDMIFKSERVKFIEPSDALDANAGKIIDSKMNASVPEDGELQTANTVEWENS
ncbi:MAG: replicative DNA helicase [Bacteroidales bacterium]|nr:replicative DNA helicase [Bacteroidales bacterium]